MTTSLAVEIQDLYKSFGEIHAVDGVSLQVAAGEVFSLLGPNGAGKSTLISMLACLLHTDRGDARVMGHSIRREPAAVKACIGVVPQEVALYEDLSAQENLAFWGKMYGLRGAALRQRVSEVLGLTGLAERRRGRVAKFSGGMKRRLNIGIALLHKPQVLIMDEPTVGIDPQTRRNILDSVFELNRAGMTVLYTTHYMEEAQAISQHIAIMDRGKVIAQGTHAELVRIVGELDRVVLTPSSLAPPLLETWQRIDGVRQLTAAAEGTAAATDGSVTVLVDDSNVVLPRLFDAATAAGVRIGSVEIHEPNLETVFLHLTGRALRDE